MTEYTRLQYLYRVLNRFFEKQGLPFKAKLLVASHVEQNNSNIWQVAELRQEKDETLVELIISDELDLGIGIYKILDP